MAAELAVTERTPWRVEGLVTGARFERARLADGRPVVLKHLPPEGDWLTRLTQGRGRIRPLWDSGSLARVSEQVDHAIIDLCHEDGADVLVMDDVTDRLLARGERLPAGSIDAILAGLAGLHRAWEGHPPEGLCTPADRHRLAAPDFHRNDAGSHPCPFSDFVLHGWELFALRADEDVTAAIFAVLDDVDEYARRLAAAAPPTLLHGDVKLGNIGLDGDRLTLIDWGECTGIGPAEMDLAWFAATTTFAGYSGPRQATWEINATPGDLFRRYEVQSGRRLVPEAEHLACIGALAQHGFFLALVAEGRPESKRATRAAQLLDWWVDRVRQALETWSPI